VKLAAWNIHHGGSNHSALASSLMAHDPDVIVLGEYRAQGSGQLVEKLRFFGWPHVATSTLAGKANGVAIVSRVPIEPKAVPLGPLPFDMWAVEAAVPHSNLTLIGVYAPLSNSIGSSPKISSSSGKRFTGWQTPGEASECCWLETSIRARRVWTGPVLSAPQTPFNTFPRWSGPTCGESATQTVAISPTPHQAQQSGASTTPLHHRRSPGPCVDVGIRTLNAKQVCPTTRC